MNKKIYSIVATCVLVLAIFAAGYFYWQGSEDRKNISVARADLARAQDDSRKDREQLDQLRSLVDEGLNKAKVNVAILKNSAETFLVAGDLKIAAISASEAEAISVKIAEITDKQDKIMLESAWSDFLASRKISDYFSFSRFLTERIQNNLENIH
ncbi:hypothetical protein HZB93_04810 [Candidatus Falkowbacteria bacterium]|nr:hypothetical protein [Candidatus Falkowbacteria bacterium]